MRCFRFLCVFSMLCMASGVVSGCSKGAPEGSGGGKSAVALKQPEDLSQRALQILNERCVACHSAERFDKTQFTAEEWNLVIDRMVAKGAKLSGDEMDVLRHWRDTE